MAEFNAGMFGSSPAREQDPAYVNSAEQFGLSAINSAMTLPKENIFEKAARPFRQRKRKETHQEAVASGLKVGTDEYVDFMQSKLTKFGDIEGVDFLEQRRQDRRKADADIKNVDSQVRSRDQATDEAESLAPIKKDGLIEDNEAKVLGNEGARLDNIKGRAEAARADEIVEEDLATKKSERLTREKTAQAAMINAVVNRETAESPAELEARERRTALLNNRLDMSKDAEKIRAEAAAEAAAGGNEIDKKDILLAREMVHSLVIKGTAEENDEMFKALDRAYGIGSNFAKDLASEDAAKRREAENMFEGIATQVAIQERDIKSEFPRMPQDKRYKLALQIPQGYIIINDPKTNGKYAAPRGQKATLKNIVRLKE